MIILFGCNYIIGLNGFQFFNLFFSSWSKLTLPVQIIMFRLVGKYITRGADNVVAIGGIGTKHRYNIILYD